MISKATPAPAAPVNDSERAIQQAQGEIARLSNKYDLFQSRLEAAANVGDALAIADIRHEYDDLPTQLSAARVRLLTLQIDAAEAQAPDAHAAAHAAGSALQQLDEEFAAVQARRAAALGRFYATREGVSMLGQNIANWRRERAGLLAAMTAPLAPVVRSLPHAGAIVQHGQ